jgi:hypothetical protein
MARLVATVSSVTASAFPGPLDYTPENSTLSKTGGVINQAKAVENKNEVPGPGKYDTDTSLSRKLHPPEFTFNSRGYTDVDRRIMHARDIPGPNQYLLRSKVDSYRGKFSKFPRHTLWNASDKSLYCYPAPHDYQDVNRPRKIRHGIISAGDPKSDLDYALYRSASMPAPDHYGIGLKSFGKNVPAGSFSTAYPKTTFEQVIFDAKQTPGPGTYKMPYSKIAGTRIGLGNPKSDVDWKIYKAKQEPGPADYMIPYLPSTSLGRFSTDKRRNLFEEADNKDFPSANDYYPREVSSSVPKGVLISDAYPKSDVEWSMYRARETPGPGEYKTVRDFNSGIKGGRISQAKVKTVLDETIHRASEIPGVGQYALRNPLKTHCGIDFGRMGDRFPKLDPVQAIVDPGPGEYISSTQATTFGRQVDSEYKSAPAAPFLQRVEILDDRLKFNNGPGSYIIPSSMGQQVLAQHRSLPSVGFSKEKARPSISKDAAEIPHATAYDSMAALDKLMKRTPATGDQAKYKAKLVKARINRWKWRSKYNFN